MGRYAVIDEKGIVQNVIEWDGIANWKPPEGCTLKPHDQVGRGDIWHEGINDFVRPLSVMMAPEDAVSLQQRAQAFEQAKEKFKSGITFINDTGSHEF